MMGDHNMTNRNDEEYFELAIRNSSLEKLATSQNKQIDEIYSSISWRVTAPLRSTLRFARKLVWHSLRFISNRFDVVNSKKICDFCGEILRNDFDHSPGSKNENFVEICNLVKPNRVAIVIPVYGRIDSLKKLMASMLRDPNLALTTTYFVDDRFDDETSKWLGKNVSFPQSHVVTCPKNLGFGGAVNYAIDRLSDDFEYIILLNSDIELPANWVSRFMAPFEDEKVGLATSLATESGANLSIQPPLGRSWLDVDSTISKMSPSYPAACTAIGYAMAIRVRAINKSELFDPAFIDGYGEDSDLHFKVLSRGFTSVVIDNLLVKHESGGSYKQKKNLNDFQKVNSELFHARWGDSYADEMFEWQRNNPVKKIQCQVDNYFSSKEIPCDVLLVVPTGDINSGGVRVAFELAESLLLKDLKVVVLTQSGGNEFNWGLKTIGEDELNLVESPKLIVATGIGTFDVSLSLSRTMTSKLGVFFQGPEMYFSQGVYYRNFRRFMQNTDLVISTSDFLSEVAGIHTSAQVTQIDYGPDSAVFYNAGLQREKTLVISSRSEIEKGLWLALPYLEYLINEGWKVKSFGAYSKILSQIESVEQLGHLSPQEISSLFNSSSMYLDLSLFEGLGLVPLEAYFCGAIPVLTRKGAPETIFTGEFDSSVIWLDSPTFSESVARRLAELSLNDLEELRRNSYRLSELRNKDKGLNQAANHIFEYLTTLDSGTVD